MESKAIVCTALIRRWRVNENVKRIFKGEYKAYMSKNTYVPMLYLGGWPVLGTRSKYVDHNKIYTEITVYQLTNDCDDYVLYRVIDFK